MSEQRRPMGERLASLETLVSAHIKSCDRKGTIAIGLLSLILAATLTGTGVLLKAALHLGG
jgi:hypothetical protein